ncbi:MAG: putative glycosyltransferase [Candidatus Scalindua rubra]|uniref:Putative glycosyltransferase n=1 Tax=Candidatus Scalindua rubra TaxID=1872076 RepID=A0A1E3XG29_9BACT|nr:MAG: putative glycosyltransferase [Candidatus Scalindua rubra]
MLFPKSRIIYRQSDPVYPFTNSKCFEKYEERIIKNCDLSLFVNKLRLKYSIKNINNTKLNYKILGNGININNLKNELAKPKEYGQLKKIALYIGAIGIDWPLLFYVARKLQDINFFVVSPIRVNKKIYEQINDCRNVCFINGVKPDKVFKFIKYCDIGIIPYNLPDVVREMYGMHAKIYQFMYAKKPIVTYKIWLEKNLFGIFESHSELEFLNNIKKAFRLKRVNYNFNFNEITWENRTRKMLDYINKLAPSVH